MISLRERFLIFTFALLSTVYFVVVISADVFTRSYPKPNPSNLVAHDLQSSPAGLNLLIVFILISLIRPGKFIVSSCLTMFYAILYFFAVFWRLDSTSSYGYVGFYTDPFVEIHAKISNYDYVAIFVILVLMVWQMSIIWRLFFRSHPDLKLP